MVTLFLCLVCQDTLPNVEALAKHMVGHQTAKLGCDRCGNQTRPVEVNCQGEALCDGCR